MPEYAENTGLAAFFNNLAHGAMSIAQQKEEENRLLNAMIAERAMRRVDTGQLQVMPPADTTGMTNKLSLTGQPTATGIGQYFTPMAGPVAQPQIGVAPESGFKASPGALSLEQQAELARALSAGKQPSFSDRLTSVDTTKPPDGIELSKMSIDSTGGVTKTYDRNANLKSLAFIQKQAQTNPTELTDIDLERLAEAQALTGQNQLVLGMGNSPQVLQLREKYAKILSNKYAELGGVRDVIGQRQELAATGSALKSDATNARLQGQKVNQAISLQTAINKGYDKKTGKIVIPPTMHVELALGLARMLSPTGTIGIELEESIRQKTLREGLAKGLIAAGADQESVGGPPQSVIRYLQDTIQREGLAAEDMRNQYTGGRSNGPSFRRFYKSSMAGRGASQPAGTRKKLPHGASLSAGEHVDGSGNRIMVYDDGTYEEVQ